MDAPLQAPRDSSSKSKQQGGGSDGRETYDRRRHHNNRNNTYRGRRINKSNSYKQGAHQPNRRHRSRSKDSERQSHNKNDDSSHNRYMNDDDYDDDAAASRHDQGTEPKAATSAAFSRKDENLPPNLQPDPRGAGAATINQRLTHKASKRGHGRNTDSFDPDSTLVRPDLRVRVGLELDNLPLRHDDVVICPEFFGKVSDWSLYYKLVQEITTLQQQEELKRQQQELSQSNQKNHNNNGPKGVDWIPWHEGAHLIVKKPEGSPTFLFILDKLCKYFQIDKSTAGYRFNWYTDGNDWKPFHHDSAAFNAQRATTQNITVGASFGACRELAFLRADDNNTGKELYRVRLYFPQTNNGVFSFGRDVNIHWKHGINALPPKQRETEKGRVSIVLWGQAANVVEEDGSPPLLGADGQGPHANYYKTDNHHNHSHQHRRSHHHKSNRNNSNRASGSQTNNNDLKHEQPVKAGKED